VPEQRCRREHDISPPALEMLEVIKSTNMYVHLVGSRGVTTDGLGWTFQFARGLGVPRSDAETDEWSK